jgi:predicted phage terminase large subunit-like protein
MDEYADMKPEVWEQILRPALADQKGGALFIGTPMGRNHFYDLYTYATVGDDHTYQGWHFTSYDNPMIDPEEINVAKKSMSSYAFRQEFMASFEAMGSDIFKEEWIKVSSDEPEIGNYYIAIDMAGFEDANKKKKKSRLDNTSIAIVKVNEQGWYVDNIIYGRWTFEETAQKIFDAVEKYQPQAVGIEKGIARQAIMSPLTDMMRQRNKFFRIEELTHGNKKKTDRIVAALQGRFEHGAITINEGDWNAEFLDELFQFPNPQVHDDLIDSLAYIDQLADITYFYDFDQEHFEMLDPIAGY